MREIKAGDTFLKIAICCVFIVLLWGCASFAKKENVLAVVNGAPITEEDLGYALNIVHRKETVDSGGGALDVLEYVEKLIGDRLIMQEARTMGLDTNPLFRRKVEEFIIRESVVKLFQDEIAGKVSVSDEEIRERFRKDFQVFQLAIIETASREDVERIRIRLETGEDFGDLAEEYSLHPSKEKRGEISFNGKSLSQSPQFEEVALSLAPGEISDPVEIEGKFYLIKLENREDAPDEKFDEARPGILKLLRKEKESERSDEYLQELREKADIELNDDVISSINIEELGEKGHEWKHDDRILARVSDKTLTVARLMANIVSAKGGVKKGESIENRVNRWIDFKVVDQEALRRNYDETPELKEKIERYENQLLKRLFIDTVVLPQIKPTDATLTSYYEQNPEQYRKPQMFRIQELFFEKEEDARKAANSLQEGADFSWVAGMLAEESGGHPTALLSEGALPDYAREVIRDMKEGEVSPLLETGDGRYVLFRLRLKSGGEVYAFNEIKSRVRQDYIKDELEKIFADYVEQLRKDAKISVNANAIEALKKKFGNAAIDNTDDVK